MQPKKNAPLVTTIGEHCRVCYTCVRECPARAIRIADGQAEVISERCIGCGNCVQVCSQSAKKVLSGIEDARALLASPATTVACVAPSFAAEFTEHPFENTIGMIRALGFDHVVEVAFGADLVARGYRELLDADPGKRWIATSCPAVVGYVERFHENLVDRLAPIVSPMIAMARVMREIHGEDVKIVFIGPCIAKKGESVCERVQGDVDATLTFRELREMLAEAGLAPDDVQPSDFDPPHPGPGALFPISRGMLQAAGIVEDLMEGEIVATDGRENFADAVAEFESGEMEARLLEVLCCQGCIMGAGMTVATPLFRRRALVSAYVRERVARSRREDWEADMERFKDLDLSRTYRRNNQRVHPPSTAQVREVMERMGKTRPEDELNCGACGYATCIDHAVAICKGRAEVEMCLPYTIEQLRNTLGELADTQQALVTSEKMASMGQLAAGIAHEVNNPLGVVLMYAHLLMEEISAADAEHAEDLRMIVEQADRCKKIVSGLLNFARQSKVDHQPTDVAGLIERTLQILTIPGNVQLEVRKECVDAVAEVDKDQIVQVLTNLVNNAVGAMEGRRDARLTVVLGGDDENVWFEVSDTGNGISESHLKKIFEPFFSTKSAAKGTGLGLSVTYGIVKMHRGDIDVESNNDPEKGPTGTRFRVRLPRVHAPAGTHDADADAPQLSQSAGEAPSPDNTP